MNLSKEEIQKLVLVVLLLIGGLYLYSTMLLDPLKMRELNEGKAMAELAPKISAAKAQISKTRALEAKAPEATKELAFVISNTPKGAPLAWFPPRVSEFAKQHGITKSYTRLTDELEESDLPGFRQLKWSVELPRTDAITFGNALAALENLEVLLEISSLQIENVADEPLQQRVVFNFSTWIKQ